jgi:deoxyribonuclease V
VWSDASELRADQEAIGRASPRPWQPPPAPDGGGEGPGLVALGCFVAYWRGEQGPGQRGDRAWVGVATWSERHGTVLTHAVPGEAAAPYRPGLLALREAPMLVAALDPVCAPFRGSTTSATDDAVLLVDATGRDHPRRAGLALHLGKLLDLPTVGITHRPLTADRSRPALTTRGEQAPLSLDGETVAAWVCTRDAVTPVVAHAGWRTDVEVAIDVALRTSVTARTPEPLRLAREAARNARATPGR